MSIRDFYSQLQAPPIATKIQPFQKLSQSKLETDESVLPNGWEPWP